MTTMSASAKRELTTEDHNEGTYDGCDARTLCRQIGTGNIMAISGLRVYDTGHGVILPVSHGYTVIVDLMLNDTYRVRRLFHRGTSVWLHGEAREVNWERVGEVARMAACFESYDAQEWPTIA